MKRVLLFVFFISICLLSSGQDNIPHVYNFTGYTGAGLTPSPGAGQLDSDSWSVTGMSDGNVDFGGTNTTGDFARGNTTGVGVTTGGLYSLNNGAIWFQPSVADFTPGTIILKICNNSASTMVDIDVDYDIKYLNDQLWASSFNLSWAKVSNPSYIPISALDFTTPEGSDANGVQTVPKSTTITANLADTDCLLLKWTSNDVSGSGSRDELGIDNLDVKENLVPTPVTLTSFTAKPMEANDIALHWTTASEENNDYFVIEHSLDGRGFYELNRVWGAGTTTETRHYEFMHKGPERGTNYYRLKQVDFDGAFSFSEVEVVVLEDHNEINLQPTLAQENIEVSISDQLANDGTIEVVNWIGQVVIATTLPDKSSTLTLNVGDLESGHYFVRIKSGNIISTSRFVKL